MTFHVPHLRSWRFFSLLIRRGRKDWARCMWPSSKWQREVWYGLRGGRRKVSNSPSPCPASSCKLVQAKNIFGGNNSDVISGEWYWYLCSCLCGVFFVFFHNNDPTRQEPIQDNIIFTSHLCCLARLDQLSGLVTDRQHRWNRHHLSESLLMYSPLWTTENYKYTVFFGSDFCLPRLLLTSQNFSEQKYISNRCFNPGPFIYLVGFVYLMHISPDPLFIVSSCVSFRKSKNLRA